MRFANLERYFARLARLHLPPLGLSINAIGNLAIAPTVISPGSNVAIPSSTETNIVATAATLTGVPGMNYIPVIIGNCVILPGATPPSAFVCAARYNGGADFDSETLDPLFLGANIIFSMPVVLVGANVRAAGNGNIGSGAIQVTGLATGQAVTARATANKFAVLLLPGPDA